jgi:hypothetical protein
MVTAIILVGLTPLACPSILRISGAEDEKALINGT